jgi:glycerate-2-kinase
MPSIREVLRNARARGSDHCALRSKGIEILDSETVAQFILRCGCPSREFNTTRKDN